MTNKTISAGSHGATQYTSSNDTVTNLGTVSGYDAFSFLADADTLINQSVIEGAPTSTGGQGVSLFGADSLTNAAGATISGFSAVLSYYSNIINAGTIAGYTNSARGKGIWVEAASSVTNQSGGTIVGWSGIYAIASTTVLNDGGIGLGPGASLGRGIWLQGGGSITNQSDGTIAAFDGIEIGTDAAPVVNAGVVAGNSVAPGGVGIVLSVGGSVSNQSGGTIAGYTGIDETGGALTVTNAGTIVGHSTSILFSGGAANRLIVDPGAVFIGIVNGANVVGSAAVSTLELASATSAGTLSGLGTQYIDFARVELDAGASWSLTNTATILSGQTIAFLGTNSYLSLDLPAGDAGTITGFAVSDTLDLRGVVAGSVTYASTGGGQLAFSLAAGGTGTIAAPGAGAVVSVSDGLGGAQVISALCFCAGTRIATPLGEKPVEALREGDLVRTASGAIRPLVWIGTGQVMVTPGHRSPATPVIVRKGALGPNTPYYDLRVTKGHSFHLDGVLIPVEFLVNHRSIVWDDRAREVTIYHLELESHDILLANGAPAESYRDDGNRWLFQNGNSGWGLPPQDPCAPVLTGGPVVDAVWKRLLDAAGVRPGMPLTDDPDLHLIVDGARIDPSHRHGSVWTFALSRAPRQVRIVSRDAVPMELGIARDARSLGVAVRGIAVLQGARFTTIGAGDPRLADGFHDYEAEQDICWTNGNARLPIDSVSGFGPGAMEIVLTLSGATRYLDVGAALAA